MSVQPADMYRRPDREQIARQVAAQNGSAAPREEAPAQPDALARFGAHLRAALRARGWSRSELAALAGIGAADVTRAANGSACGLSLAEKIAAALGADLAAMLQPLSCTTCAGTPPEGFACLRCGAGRAA